MKLYVIRGINHDVQAAAPLGLARTPEGRDKILADTAWCSDVQRVFELDVEEDKAIPDDTRTTT